MTGWMRRSRLRTLCCTVVAGCLATRVTAAQSGTRGTAPAVGADVIAQSLAFEAQGDLVRARKVIVDAFGAQPDSYEPCVRLAAISLQMRRSADAVLLYRIARGMQNSSPEATLGLGLALTMHGYDRMGAGAYGDARSDFVESLLIDDGNREAKKGLTLLGGPRGTGVDAMASVLSGNDGASRAQLYAIHFPVRVDEHLSLRFAARQLTGPTFAASTSAFVSQTHLYAGVVRDIGRNTVDVMTFMVVGSGPTNLGAAISLRSGGEFGLHGTLAGVGLTGGTNVQFAPTVVWRPSQQFVIAGGVRVTHDAAGTVTSPIASIGVRSTRVTFDVLTHLGSERWAYNAGGPSLQPWLGTTTGGVTGTLSIGVSRRLSLLAQAQAEQSKTLGAYRTVGIGCRVASR